MRLIHLSDLHLGKRVNEISMLEDQHYILEEIIRIADGQSAEAVLIAGDIYDKSVPSAEAVQELDTFLTELSERNIPVFLVGGNHDSQERLSFGARLLEKSSIYVSKVYDGQIEPVTLQDAYGDLNFYMMPFLKPAVVRHALERETINSYQEAVQAALERLAVDTEKRNILIAHQFVTGADRCDSEEFFVGGMDNVDVSVFSDFDYVALGHIHGPQKMGRETVRYCGTPLKYSFSEVSHKKSVTVIDIREKGDVEISTVPLIPLRDMRKIRGTYREVTARDFYSGTNTEDYVQITLTDEEDIPNGLEKLRVIYPNMMRLEYDNKRTREKRLIEKSEEAERKSELDLFEQFYAIQNNQPMSEQQRKFVEELILRRKEAER